MAEKRKDAKPPAEQAGGNARPEHDISKFMDLMDGAAPLPIFPDLNTEEIEHICSLASDGHPEMHDIAKLLAAWMLERDLNPPGCLLSVATSPSPKRKRGPKGNDPASQSLRAFDVLLRIQPHINAGAPLNENAEGEPTAFVLAAKEQGLADFDEIQEEANRLRLAYNEVLRLRREKEKLRKKNPLWWLSHS